MRVHPSFAPNGEGTAEICAFKDRIVSIRNILDLCGAVDDGVHDGAMALVLGEPTERLYGSKRIASFEIRGKMALIRGSYGYLKIIIFYF